MAELPMAGVARFIKLLYEATDASKRCDHYDLHSEDVSSAEQWVALQANAREAMTALVDFCADNRHALLAEIREVTKQ